MELSDLSPKRDPKGGSPKTPVPMSVQDYVSIPNTNGGWKTISGGLIGLLAGMIVAYVTSMMTHGVSRGEMEEYVRQSQLDQEKTALTRPEMHEYVDKFSPWNFDKTAIINRMATQDQNIGELRAKIDLAAKYLEQQQQQPKR